MIDADTSVRQAERIAARVVGGKAVVVVIDDQRIHTLNAVGTFIWSLVDSEDRRVSEIVEAVQSEFEVARSCAEADVHAFLRELVALGALEADSS